MNTRHALALVLIATGSLVLLLGGSVFAAAAQKPVPGLLAAAAVVLAAGAGMTWYGVKLRRSSAPAPFPTNRHGQPYLPPSAPAFLAAVGMFWVAFLALGLMEGFDWRNELVRTVGLSAGFFTLLVAGDFVSRRTRSARRPAGEDSGKTPPAARSSGRVGE